MPVSNEEAEKRKNINRGLNFHNMTVPLSEL